MMSADGLKGSVSCRNLWLSIWPLEVGSYQAVKDQGKLQVIQANYSLKNFFKTDKDLKSKKRSHLPM